MRTSAAMKPTPALKPAPRPAARTSSLIVSQAASRSAKPSFSSSRSETREVMDIRQASDYLGISPDTLYKYASEGFVPAFKLGNRWRFKKSRLDEWMDQQSDASMANPEVVPARQKKPVRAAR